MKGKEELEKALKNKENIVAMLAPSFIAEFDYPYIVRELRRLGFSKIVELTFGAKIVNKEYHKILEKEGNKFWISSVCPGIVCLVKNKFPQYEKNLMPVVSPMVATAMLCKKVYPGYKTCFISPCTQKKQEAFDSKFVDFAVDYKELWEIINSCCLESHKKGKPVFDLFYNEYTRIYPVSGGLSRTAHLKGVLKAENAKVIDGCGDVSRFLQNPDKNIKFLDCTFCEGGCIGGNCTSNKTSLEEKKKRVLKYLELAKNMKIPKERRGVFKKAEGIDLRR